MILFRLTRLISAAVLCCGVAMNAAPPALAAHQQQAMFLDNYGILADPVGLLGQLRRLGVDRIRQFVAWNMIAPNPRSRQRPRNFRAADPKSYPEAQVGSARPGTRGRPR